MKLLILSLFLICSCYKFTEPEDCAGVAGGSAVEDCAGVCGGVETNCIVQLGLSNNSEALYVTYDSYADIAGFQFVVTGTTITNADGGAAEEAGFTVTTANNLVLGFFFGTTIPAGSGVLTYLSYTGSSDNVVEICLSSPLISDLDSEGLVVELGGCITM